MEGKIVKNISNDYVVLANNVEYICKARGKFRLNNIIPLVGDNVIFDEVNKYITDIKKRDNVLVRPPVSNVDQAIIVVSVKEPIFNTNLLDKMLTIISYNNIKPIICLSKLDLLNEKELDEINKYINYYSSLGYIVVLNHDKDKLRDIISNKVSVLTGQSGAGKSSLLNYLDSSLKLKTDSISHALGRGKHTTRCVSLYKIYDGFIVDTPGFSSLTFDGMSKIDIRDNMQEMFDNLEYCKYRDCMHIKEDGCKVKEKVNNKEILLSRYENYKNFIEK